MHLRSLRPKPPFPNRPRPSSSHRRRGVTPDQSPILSYFIRVAYGWSDLLLFFPLRWRGVPLRFLTRTGDLHLKNRFLFCFIFRDISSTNTHTHTFLFYTTKERKEQLHLGARMGISSFLALASESGPPGFPTAPERSPDSLLSQGQARKKGAHPHQYMRLHLTTFSHARMVSRPSITHSYHLFFKVSICSQISR